MFESAGLLYCNCSYAQIIDPAVQAGVLQRLRDSGRPFESVADLCELSARQDPALARLRRRPGVKIAACHPRAVKWLLAAAGAPLDPARTEIVNLRELAAATAAERLLADDLQPNLPPDPAPPAASRRVVPAGAATPAGAWQPWFPVIDYDRCTHCMHCLSFCLFGVYGVDAAGGIQVQKPDNCKTN
jgi:hypothetical protein